MKLDSIWHKTNFKKLLVWLLISFFITIPLLQIGCINQTTTGNLKLNVHFIDVGQGDAILLDYGLTEVLIDGGGSSSEVAPFLQQYVDGALEVMVATHAHADHIGGLTEVLDHYQVEQIWQSGDTSTSKTYRDFMDAVNNEGAAVYSGKSGENILSGGLSFKVLNPDFPDGTSNNNSLVLLLKFGTIEFLFEGDAEQEAEGEILSAYTLMLTNIDILKLGHHGSRTASSLAFLAVIHPSVAVYMAETGNTYGHPHQETLTNLNNIGALIYGTDVNSSITIETDGQTYAIQIEKSGTPQAP